MRRSLKILLALSAFFVVVIGGAIAFTLPHWWIRVGFAESRGLGEAESPASVYRSTSGDILFLVPDNDSSVDCYVFYSATTEISIPSCSSQIHSFGIIAFSNESPIPGVLSSNKVKVETDMDLVVNDDAIEFTTLSGRRIKAKR